MSTDKITRTIRLNPDVDQRLVDLCKHIGTNPNAYLISEIGKCISRDEIAFVAQRKQADFLDKFTAMIEAAQAEGQEQDKE